MNPVNGLIVCSGRVWDIDAVATREAPREKIYASKSKEKCTKNDRSKVLLYKLTRMVDSVYMQSVI